MYLITKIKYAEYGLPRTVRTHIETNDIEMIRRELKRWYRCEKVLFEYEEVGTN